jgi:cell division septal protein FtsQ
MKLVVWVGSAAGLAWAVHRGVEQAAWLRIRDVRITDTVPAAASRKITLRAGDSLLGFSAGRLEARLLADHPELAEVRVRRSLDRRVTIDAVRRRPRAKMPAGTRWLGIDEAGRAFPLSSEDAADELPVIHAPAGTARAALHFLEALRATRAPWTEKLQKIKLTAEEEAELFLREDTVIHWGPVTWDEDRLALRARRLERLFRQGPPATGASRVRFVTDDRLAVTPRSDIAPERPTDR